MISHSNLRRGAASCYLRNASKTKAALAAVLIPWIGSSVMPSALCSVAGMGGTDQLRGRGNARPARKPLAGNWAPSAQAWLDSSGYLVNFANALLNAPFSSVQLFSAPALMSSQASSLASCS